MRSDQAVKSSLARPVTPLSGNPGTYMAPLALGDKGSRTETTPFEGAMLRKSYAHAMAPHECSPPARNCFPAELAAAAVVWHAKANRILFTR
jgi:hypothetical protein